MKNIFVRGYAPQLIIVAFVGLLHDLGASWDVVLQLVAILSACCNALALD